MKIDKMTMGLIVEVVKETVKETDRLRAGENKRKHDNRLRNVKLLLKNYRSFKRHGQQAKEDIPELMKALELDDFSDDAFQIKSILANRKRTAAMVVYIERMIEVYRTSCKESHYNEDWRRYQILNQLYFLDEKKTIDEVAELHFISRRTLYNDIDHACKALAVLMFGIDGVQFEAG
ncbi:hypothetical protein ACI2JA_15605 [Alkalihalobacillus sp. NPDC078783]